MAYIIILRLNSLGKRIATTSARANFLSILQEKTYFFYFTHSLLQNTHISLSILHIYLIKYSFFLHFLLFHFLSSLAQTHHLVFSLHTQPATLPQNPAIDSPIFHNNKIRPLIHRSSTTTKSGHWFTNLPQPAPSRKTNSLNPKPSQSQTHSSPTKPETQSSHHHLTNLKPTDDLMIWSAWFDDRRGLRLMIWSAWFDDRRGLRLMIWSAWLVIGMVRWSAAMDDRRSHGLMIEKIWNKKPPKKLV